MRLPRRFARMGLTLPTFFWVLLLVSLGQATQIVYVGEDAGVVGVFGRDYRYFNIPDSVGGTPGPGWFTLDFDHSAWRVGETVFGNTGGIESVPTEHPGPPTRTCTYSRPLSWLLRFP